NAQEAGLRVELVPLPMAEFLALYESPEARARVDAFYTDGIANIPDPTQWYTSVAVPGGAIDYGYRNAEVTRLLTQAVAESDEDARAELTAQAQAILTRELAAIPVASIDNSGFLNRSLTGVATSMPAPLYWPWGPDVGAR